MGLGNQGNNKNSGNKGSNFNYEKRMLQSFATLTSTILATAALKEFEVNLVRDTGNANYVALEILKWNTNTGSFDPPIYQNPDGTPYIPIGPLVYIDYSTQLALIAGYLAPAVRTPGKIISSTTGTVSAGKVSVTVWNKGMAPGTVLGQTLEAGEVDTWSVVGKGDTLGAITYDGTGTTLVITTVG